MPLPLLIGVGLLVGGIVVAFWAKIKQLAYDIAISLYKTAKKSKNALKMIAKGFAEGDIFKGEYRLIQKGSKFILETFIHEFTQTPTWKVWKSEPLELEKRYKERETIDESEVPSKVKEASKTKSEFRRETLKLVT